MKRVCVIGTGGTIAAEEKIVKGKKIWDSEAFPVDYIVSIPELESIADIETKNLYQMHSANIKPQNWVKMAETVYENLEKYDGIVITHGTDTMNYTGAALSFMLQNLNKPVILTGAQTAASVVGSDAKRNILDSVKVAADADIAEVCIVFHGQILRANKTKKFRETTFSSFKCLDGPVGHIEPELRFTGHYVKADNQIPVLDAKINEKVFLLKLYPGMEPSVITKIMNHGYKGLVIEAYGAGNVPTEEAFIPKIKDLVDNGIPVVITTQCIIGSPWMAQYEIAQRSIDAGAIDCQDMLSETALVKLMWVLAHAKKMDKIREMMRTNYAGEISKEKGR